MYPMTYKWRIEGFGVCRSMYHQIRRALYLRCRALYCTIVQCRSSCPLCRSLYGKVMLVCCRWLFVGQRFGW